MNRMEVEAKSDECIDYHDGQTTVSMKNAVSLGTCAVQPQMMTHTSIANIQPDRRKMVSLQPSGWDGADEKASHSTKYSTRIRGKKISLISV